MKVFGNGNHIFGYGFTYYGINNQTYYVYASADENGVVSAYPESGLAGDIVTLYTTANNGYHFDHHDITGAELTGNSFAFVDSDVNLYANFAKNVYTLTLQNDGHGTLTANKVTGYAGDTVTLTPTYNTYYRFNNYSYTGGSIAGNVFTFGDTDATAKANFKVNAFTATGGWEKGSNVSFSTIRNSALSIGRHYATRNASTGDIPASWYSTSNRWNPSNASAYKITLNPKATVTSDCGGAATGKFVCCTLVNATQNQSQTWTAANFHNATWTYSKSFSTTTQTTYSISGYIAGTGTNGVYTTKTAKAGYVANRTSGTWTATGYAP